MIRMTLALFAVCAALALPVASFAQNTGGSSGGMSGGSMGSHGAIDPQKLQAAVQQLNLTPSQKMQIAPMVKNYKAQTATADAATKQADTIALMKNINTVLTPDQRTKLQSMMMQHAAGSQ